MSESKRMPLIHRGVNAERIYPCAPIDKYKGRETDRAINPESACLMLDFFTILEFDAKIQYFQRQPVTLEYCEHSGIKRYFTPEFLITYRRDIQPARLMKPLLCDVMTRRDVLRNWSDWQPCVKSAHRYAQQRNWIYRILTERQIRTPYLENARLLLPYFAVRTKPEYHRILLNNLLRLGKTKIEVLLDACSTTHPDSVDLWNSLYQLIAFGRIGMNLHKRFDLQSIIWHND